MDCSQTRLCPWDFPGKNTGGDCHVLLQGIFPMGMEPRFPTLQVDSLPSELPYMQSHIQFDEF